MRNREIKDLAEKATIALALYNYGKVGFDAKEVKDLQNWKMSLGSKTTSHTSKKIELFEKLAPFPDKFDVLNCEVEQMIPFISKKYNISVGQLYEDVNIPISGRENQYSGGEYIGKRKIPDYEAKNGLIAKTFPKLNKFLDFGEKIRILGLNPDIIFDNIETFEKRLSKRKNIPVIHGTWIGWSIYPLHSLIEKKQDVFAYKVIATFDQEGSTFRLNEKIFKIYNISQRTPAAEPNRIEYSHIKKGSIADTILFVHLKDETAQLSNAFLSMTVYHDPRSYLDKKIDKSELSGYVTIKKAEDGRFQSIAAMKLWREENRNVLKRSFMKDFCETILKINDL